MIAGPLWDTRDLKVPPKEVLNLCCWIMTSSAGPDTSELIMPAEQAVATFITGLRVPSLPAK